ncbi:pre-peptidase C-terminal domain-containing protein [Sorangium sp. So ce131]|uniref:pre-peptidase C-terminal domain-containing protein n=1 Tax=Sorangium sp. So ce131 TaxID=3133282 RepID=UPI003F5DA029
MSRHRVSRGAATAALLFAAAGAAACGGDEGKPPPKPPAHTSGGDGGDAGGGAEGGGGAAPGACGNGVAEAGEACDGPDLQGADCRSVGFETGELGCSPGCALDTSRCAGVEVCQDGRDNDGDGGVDCSDTDCAEACADMCAAPVALPDPAVVTGDTSGHEIVGSDCTFGAPGVAYTFTATTTGFLDVLLTPQTDAALVPIVRSACDDEATAIACGGESPGTGVENRLSVPVREGDALYVVVTGADPNQAGAFDLTVRSRETVCGDRIQDPSEACDNEVGRPDDGCSDECRLEATEVEPNDTTATANVHSAPFFAAISPGNDVDFVRVTVPSGPINLVAETADVTSADCLHHRIDTAIEILDDSGARIVRSEAGGTGRCARAAAPGLAAGDYYVRVSAGAGAAGSTFPYRLDVALVATVCGDGNVSDGEQCDDGNTAPNDGCSPTCRFYLTETEPNATPAQADVYVAPWLAEIGPARDVDVVAVEVPGPSSTLLVNVHDNGTGTCVDGRLDSYIELIDDDGVTVLAWDGDSGEGNCSFLSQADLAAGTYYVRVKAPEFIGDATFFYRLNVTIL